MRVPDGHTVQLVLELPLSPGVEELANRLARVDWQGLLSVPFAQPGGADA